MGRVPPENQSTARLRCYAELNDFLPEHRRFRDFEVRFLGTAGVKDLIEAAGVPHTELDLVLINGLPVSLAAVVQPGDRISAYPMFERFDIGSTSPIHRSPLREPRFIVDVHLGRLARDLRLLGFDTVWRNDLSDEEIRQRSLTEHRVILTRDRGLLRHGAVDHGCFVRATEPLDQLREVVQALQLETAARPWSRCTCCNHPLRDALPHEVQDRVPPGVAARHQRFRLCESCGRIYWRGTHYLRMRERLRRAGVTPGAQDETTHSS